MSGAVVWLFCTNQEVINNPNAPNEIPPSLAANLPTGTQLPPPFTYMGTNPPTVGTAVWSSIAFDPLLNRIYVGTGNAVPDSSFPCAYYANGVIALDALTGTLMGFFSRLSPTAIGNPQQRIRRVTRIRT